jgi:putative tricarboxylic transport membrane protein
MAILLVYMLVLSTVGFIIPSVIMLFAFCQWFHRGAVWKNAVISIAVILVIYYVFKNFLTCRSISVCSAYRRAEI